MGLTFQGFWWLVWLGGGLVAFLTLPKVHDWRRALGLGLMSVPIWIAAWGFVDSIEVLIDSGSRPAARSVEQLQRLFWRTILIDVGYLGSGFLLWTSHLGWPASVRDIAGRIRDAGARVGPEGRGLILGFVAFPLLLAGSLLTDAGVRQADALVNGDESLIFRNMDPLLALLISMAAGFTEELVYRGFLLTILAAGLSRLMPARRAMGVAVVGQAVLFGVAHAGYGTWAHLIVPLLFGLFAGVVTVRLGLWAAIVMHVLIDVFALGSYAIPGRPWWQLTLFTLLAANVLVSVGWLAFQGIRRRRADTSA